MAVSAAANVDEGGGPPMPPAPAGAADQFSHSVSKWNHSASPTRSPAAEVVGVRAEGIMPGDGDGPVRLAELRLSRSGACCCCCCCRLRGCVGAGLKVPGVGWLVRAVGVVCDRKKLAMGSGVSVARIPGDVLGMEGSSCSADVAGALATIMLWKVVRMYTSLLAWGSVLAQ